jgi:hypothetical protein
MSASSRLASILDGMTKGPLEVVHPDSPVGIWRVWGLEDGERTHLFAACTTEANAVGATLLRNAPWLALVQAVEALELDAHGPYQAEYGGLVCPAHEPSQLWPCPESRLRAALADLERSLEAER